MAFTLATSSFYIVAVLVIVAVTIMARKFKGAATTCPTNPTSCIIASGNPNSRRNSNNTFSSTATSADNTMQVSSSTVDTTIPTTSPPAPPTPPTTQPPAASERPVSLELSLAEDGHVYVVIVLAVLVQVLLSVNIDDTISLALNDIANPTKTNTTNSPATTTTTTCQKILQATSTSVTQSIERLVAVATSVTTSGYVSLVINVLPQPLVRFIVTPLEEACAVATTITIAPEATITPPACKAAAPAHQETCPLMLAPSPSEACMSDWLAVMQQCSPSSSSISSISSAPTTSAPCTAEAVITLAPAQTSIKKPGKAGRRSLAASITATLRKWDAELAAANRRLQEKLEAAASKRAARREAKKAKKAAKAAAKAAQVKVAKESTVSSGRLLVAKVLRRLTGEARAVAQMA